MQVCGDLHIQRKRERVPFTRMEAALEHDEQKHAEVYLRIVCYKIFERDNTYATECVPTGGCD
jgi:hypothetical protein